MLSSAYHAAPVAHQATAAGSLAPHIVPLAVLAGACCVHPRRIRSRPRRSSSSSVSIGWFWLIGFLFVGDGSSAAGSSLALRVGVSGGWFGGSVCWWRMSIAGWLGAMALDVLC